MGVVVGASACVKESAGVSAGVVGAGVSGGVGTAAGVIGTWRLKGKGNVDCGQWAMGRGVEQWAVEVECKGAGWVQGLVPEWVWVWVLWWGRA